MNLTAQQIKDNFTPYELYTIVNNYLEDGEFIKPTNDYAAELQKESLQDLRLDLDVLNSYNIDFSDKYILLVDSIMYSTNELADCLNNLAMNDALEQYVKLDNANPTTVQNYHKLTQVDTLETVLGTIDSQEDSFKETIASKNVEELTGDNIDCLHEYETAKRIILDFEMYYHDGAQEHTLDTIKVFDKDNLTDRVQDHDIQLSYLFSPDDKTARWYRVISSNVYHTI